MAKFTFEVNDQDGFLHTKYTGELAPEDILGALVEGNRLFPNMNSLVDFSEASLANINTEEIRRLTAKAIEVEPHGILCAFVVSRDLEYGLSRMYDALSDADLPQTRRVFRTYDEALDWLQKC